MDGNRDFFIRVLADYVMDRATEPCINLNWEIIGMLAKNHEVEGIVYYQCKNFIPSGYYSSYKKAFDTALFLYVNRKKEISIIERELQNERITFCCVKGLTIAQYYPQPALRTMSDLDIVVSSPYMKKAIAVMKHLGYSGDNNTNVHEWSCRKSAIHIEIHDKLVRHGDYLKRKQVSCLNSFEEYIQNESLDWSFHFIFLLVHIRKHLINCGVGIRQFMDLALVIKNGPELHWDWIEANLKDLELDTYANTCLCLLKYWFGIDLPVSASSIDEDALQLITEKILDNGLFGFSSDENRKNRTYAQLAFVEGPLWKQRIIKLIRNTFPNYDIMRGYPGFGYLDSRPYLLPFSWIHRFFSLLTRENKKKSMDTVRGSFVPQEEMERYNSFLNKMGI